MYRERDLSQITTRCNEITNSPYSRRSVPPELQNLRITLERVRHLTNEDVPALIAEIKQLRIRNRKLEAENDALRSAV
jgi:hypothetical protein